MINRANLDRPAVYDAWHNRQLSYRELLTEIEDHRKRLELDNLETPIPAGSTQASRKKLLFLFARNDLFSLLGYLTALENGHAICLLDARLDDSLKRHLVKTYQPDLVGDASIQNAEQQQQQQQQQQQTQAQTDWQQQDYEPIPHTHGWWRSSVQEPIHPDLALLLPTSGSTGSPKLVRLGLRCVVANARCIAAALSIDSAEKAITSLPMHYSYGLSVINSHLHAGASIVLYEPDLFAPDFWNLVRQQQCTSLAGVPYSYELINRLGLERLNIPTVRTLTVAGGKLNNTYVTKFHEEMAKRGGRMFVMYGQTEATARMCILPSDRLPEKLGSAGIAIPEGKLFIEQEDGQLTTAANVSGQVVYQGPNVMLGYAECREDLRLGDLLNQQLLSGDIGYLDDEGFLYLTGRSKRFAKVVGLRINLDDIETWLSDKFPVAASAGEEKVFVFTESVNHDSLQMLASDLAKKLRLPATTFECRALERLPRTSNGKIDYQRLATQ